MIVKDSKYWLNEKDKTETELADIINGDLSTVKTSKTDEDSITQFDIDRIIKAKLSYINYCKARYEEELSKENQAQKEKPKYILRFDRECGY